MDKMTLTRPRWKKNRDLAMGKAGIFQQWNATLGENTLEIDVAPWGEGFLRVNGRAIGHIKDAKDRRHAFGELNKMAQVFIEQTQPH